MTRTSERSGARAVSLSIALLAAPFGIAGSIHGYANENERDDNQQRCDNDVHAIGYTRREGMDRAHANLKSRPET